MVWSKAIKDTTGLREFYEANRDKYMWDNRIDATMISSAAVQDLEKAFDLVNKGIEPEKLKEILVNEEPLDIQVQRKKFTKGENEFVDNVDWKAGLSPVVYDSKGKAGFLVVHELIGPEPKSLSQARGLITADYQNYLEEKWIKELRAKYTVKVNEDVLSGLK
jgi:peptidyl-prolyl cis-trans isomerase SurA